MDSGLLGRDSDVIDLRLWAKARGLGDSRYPLACHLLDAGAAARLLWDRYVPPGLRRVISEGLGVTEGHAGLLVAQWAALHDIGKITPEFQFVDRGAQLPGYPSNRGQQLRHDLAAHKWLQAVLPSLGYAGGGQLSPSFMLAQLLGGHHGTFHAAMLEVRPGAALRRFGFADDKWQEQREATFRTVSGILGAPEPPPELDPLGAVLSCAIIILADWLVSQESYLLKRLGELPQRGTTADLEEHFGRSLQSVGALIAEAGLGTLELRPGSFSELFPQITEPNALQRSVSDCLPRLATGAGLLLITAPPGAGKTEMGLYAARVMGEAAGRPGLYLALPTTATADQMFMRVLNFARDNATGDAPLALLHSMAWLNTQYIGEEPQPGQVLTGDDHDADPFAPTDWLLGRHRGICAPWAVGTVDQALMAVLKSRYNVLRLFGLAGKTVVVDEVHACDPYMQGLLRQLLRWLGTFGTPVVLLSATVTTSSARALISAYLEGAHRRHRARELADQAVVHPAGWVYVPMNGQITTAKIDLPERLPLHVVTREIARVPDAKTGPDRQPVLRAELSGLVAEGGCALVICTTVAEAQQTFTQLRSSFAELAASGISPPELDLLHSRFPAWQRAEITSRVMDRFGKNGHRDGNRPQAAVLVATAIVEQSLDLDFDLIISDLAPVALLLQRAGRSWRHEDLGVITRPRWASGPRLVVLVPPGGPDKPELFRSWLAIYDESLLTGTYQLLAQHDTIRIPGDTQGLVDDVYNSPELIDGMLDAVTKRLGTEIAQRQLAARAAIPAPWQLSSLYELTEMDIDPELVATRFDADSIRVLPVFADDAGEAWLDAECTINVPGIGGGPLSRPDCRTIIERTIPVRGGPWHRLWRGRPDADSQPPESWSKNPYLRNLVLLPHGARAVGVVTPANVGGRTFLLDAELGLRTDV